MKKLTSARINCGLTQEKANCEPLLRRAEELCINNKDFIEAHKDEITPVFGIIDTAPFEDLVKSSEALQELQKNAEICKNCKSLGKFVGYGNPDKCLMDSQFQVVRNKQQASEKDQG